MSWRKVNGAVEVGSGIFGVDILASLASLWLLVITFNPQFIIQCFILRKECNLIRQIAI